MKELQAAEESWSLLVVFIWQHLFQDPSWKARNLRNEEDSRKANREWINQLKFSTSKEEDWPAQGKMLCMWAEGTLEERLSEVPSRAKDSYPLFKLSHRISRDKCEDRSRGSIELFPASVRTSSTLLVLRHIRYLYNIHNYIQLQPTPTESVTNQLHSTRLIHSNIPPQNLLWTRNHSKFGSVARNLE